MGDLAIDDARRRRTFLELAAQILDTCRTNVGKTTLMYRCNMSFHQLNGYLDMMLNAKLLHIENNGRQLLFRVSGKGKHFLNAYKNLKSLME